MNVSTSRPCWTQRMAACASKSPTSWCHGATSSADSPRVGIFSFGFCTADSCRYSKHPACRSQPRDLGSALSLGQQQTPEKLGDTPCLCDATARTIGLVCIENFTDVTDAILTEVSDQTVQCAPCACEIIGVNAQARVDVWADQPAPYR